jgi:HlyD family secretion protein
LNVTVLYVIAEDLTKMQVAADVDEADIGEVAVGQSVTFTVEAYPGQTFNGTVWQVRINPVTTSNVVTYAVIINTANPDGKLLPGMTATVNVINATRENVLRVPVAATRFVPPPEFIAELPANARDSARHRGPRPGGDSAHRHQMMATEGTGAGAVQPSFATIYLKTKGAKGDQLQPVRIVTGLSDPDNAELLRSNPQLKVGDSVVVAAFTMSATPSASTSPLGQQQRPGGHRGGGR